MFKICKTLILSLITSLFISIVCNAEEYTNFSNIIENNKTLNGHYITVKGEAIGEPMKRGEHTWVNISDGSTCIGIWLNNVEAEKITIWGSYKNKGDIVRINTVFNNSCIEHDGEMDFHGDKLEVIQSGYSLNHPINKRKITFTIIISSITLILSFIYFKLIKTS